MFTKKKKKISILFCWPTHINFADQHKSLLSIYKYWFWRKWIQKLKQEKSTQTVVVWEVWWFESTWFPLLSVCFCFLFLDSYYIGERGVRTFGYKKKELSLLAWKKEKRTWPCLTTMWKRLCDRILLWQRIISYRLIYF